MCEEVVQCDRTWQHWRQVREKLAELLDCICSVGQVSACRCFSAVRSVCDGLCSVVNIVRGCKVAFTVNVAHLYGPGTGTRGKVVGAIYGVVGIGSSH